MCNVLIADPTNRKWTLSANDDLSLQLTSTSLFFQTSPTILKAPTTNWVVTVGLDQMITLTPTNVTGTVSSIVLKTPTGAAYALTVDDTGQGALTSVNPLTDASPKPTSISMSQFPESDGVVCPSCGNASVNVRADMSCWCCVCTSFVKPEDTSMLVVLDE